MGKKFAVSMVLVIIAIIAGFILLLRGCLAAYDERSAIAPVLYFEKDGKAVIFTIVKYDATTSYKSGGGFTSKTVSTTYYAQINDAHSGEKIDKKKLKNHSDIKNYPVSIMGSGGGRAWVFLNEPMAFDPFTLETVADKSVIEKNNPALKGKMPDQSRYYEFNPLTAALLITATDGAKYSLNTSTLVATAIDEEGAKTDLQVKIKALEKQKKEIDKQYKENYDRYRSFNLLYGEKKISYNAYLDSSKIYSNLRDTVEEKRKRIDAQLYDLKDLEDIDKETASRRESLRGNSKSYTSICVPVDTFKGAWYGLLSSTDPEKFDSRFRYQAVYDETARNRFHTGTISIKDPSKTAPELDLEDPQQLNKAVYLQGGFLLDKSTGLPIHLRQPDGFIVCYREKVGNDGHIILARVDLQGNSKWTVNTNLDHFIDWLYTGDRLIVLGIDNKELSSDEVNVLHIIDLQNGAMVTHDYFTDKMRTK